MTSNNQGITNKGNQKGAGQKPIDKQTGTNNQGNKQSGNQKLRHTEQDHRTPPQGK